MVVRWTPPVGVAETAATIRYTPSMAKTIPLGNSLLITIVDDEDYERFRGFRWGINTSGYVTRGKSRGVFLHREITGAPDGVICDHINRQILDNRKSELRLVTIRKTR